MLQSKQDMYLIEVIPLTRIPIQGQQILTYFSIQPLTAGCLVSVPLGRRVAEAIVIEMHEIKERKIEIKKASYKLRPIKKILTAKPILTPAQIKLALWLGEYYFAPASMFLKMQKPKFISATLAGTKIQNVKTKVKNYKPQKLIIVPLISQITAIQKNYPQEKVAIIHSGLRKKELIENWQKIASGEAKIIIGARIAVFAPFANLKEIIIKDAINPGHRSYDMFPHYRVHEVAQKLSEIFEAKISFESDLPSVEDFFKTNLLSHPGEAPCQNNEINKKTDNLNIDSKIKILSECQNKAEITNSEETKTEIVDLRQELKDGNFSIFSRVLQQAIRETLKQKKQVILFINRRGLATFVLCRDCGYVVKCANCETPLTYHLIRENASLKPALICHHCGQKTVPPTLCPKCQSYRIKAFGSGSQRVEIEAQKLFKDAKILRLDSDIAKTAPEQQKIIEQFRAKKADILIGTQALFDADVKASLVAVISADTLMHLPDWQSNERLFQTIVSLKKMIADPPFSKDELSEFLNKSANSPLPRFTKVKNIFFLQTYNPQNKTLQLAAENNFKKFYEQEITARKLLKYPPFSQLIKLIFRHRDPRKAAQEAKILFAKLTQQLKMNNIYKEVILDIIGPAPAFIPKEKQKYIWQIILKVKPIWIRVGAHHSLNSSVPPTKQDKQHKAKTFDSPALALFLNKNNDELLKIRNRFLMLVPSHWEVNVDPETLL